MPKLSSLDWSNASDKPRKILYQAIKNRIDNGRTSWNEVLKSSFGNAPELTDDFMSRLRRGTLAKRYFGQMSENFEESFPEEAQAVAEELSIYLSVKPASDLWGSLIKVHGQLGLLTIINPQAISLTRREDHQIKSKIKLGEAYVFQLNSENEGSALLLERHELGDWYPIALGKSENDLIGPIKTGTNILPHDDETDQPVILRDYKDIGLREFVLIIDTGLHLLNDIRLPNPNEAVSLAWLNQFASRILELETLPEIHSTQVIFISGN